MKKNCYWFVLLFFFYIGCGFGGVELFQDIKQQHDVNNIKMNPRFSMSVQKGSRPLEVHFMDQSSGEISEWSWDFDGDGIVDSREKNPVHIYNYSGKYVPSLHIAGQQGQKSLTGDSVFVNEDVASGSIDFDNILPISIAKGDFNNDGYSDILTVDNAVSGLIWYPGRGDGHFDEPVRISNGDGFMYVCSGDFDLDGDDDVASVTIYPNEELIDDEVESLSSIMYQLSTMSSDIFNEHDTYIAWWENVDSDTPGSGNGFTWQKHMVSPVDSMFFFPSDLRVVDMDGDGDPDLLGGARYHFDFADIGIGAAEAITDDDILSERVGKTNKATWWENQPDSGRWIEHDIALFDCSVGFVQPGDINNDGRLDILVSIKHTNKLYWFERLQDYTPGDLSDPADLWRRHKVMDLYNASAFSIGDYDLDGTLDVVAASWDRGDIYLLKTTDKGLSWEREIMPGEYSNVFNIVSLDPDNDGDLDLLLSPQEEGTLVWIENRPGEGWFNRIIDFGYKNIASIIGVDMDNNGVEEIFCSQVTLTDNIHWWKLLKN